MAVGSCSGRVRFRGEFRPFLLIDIKCAGLAVAFRVALRMWLIWGNAPKPILNENHTPKSTENPPKSSLDVSTPSNSQLPPNESQHAAPGSSQDGDAGDAAKQRQNSQARHRLATKMVFLDPQTTHKNWISPYNFGGQTPFLSWNFEGSGS